MIDRSVEKKRRDVLAHAKTVRASFLQMLSRCHAAGETPNQEVIKGLSVAMERCEARMAEETDVSELEWLQYEASVNGQLRAYLCPLEEIYGEGESIIDLLRDWGFSDASVKRLRVVLEKRCKSAESNPAAARGGLRLIMAEADTCEDYAEQVEDQLYVVSWILLPTIVISLGLSLVALIGPINWQGGVPVALFLAGVAGSCTSVLARMPISEIPSSAVSVAMNRTILIRIGTGISASVVGCALLAWGVFPIGINNVSFANIVQVCSPFNHLTCTADRWLVLLAVPVLLGFSERLLTTFENKLFGQEDSNSQK